MGSLEAQLTRFKSSLAQQGSAWDVLRHLPAALQLSNDGARAVCRSFGEQLAALGEVGASLHTKAAALKQDLGGFEARVAAADSIRRTCAALGDDALRLRDRLAALGFTPTEEPASLHALIERFTLFEHKQLAAGAANLHLAADSRPGELTLF
jgi:hypothetical protein